MTKDKLVHDIKTVGVAVGTALTMHACGNVDRTLTPEQLQTVEHKTDSAKRFHPEYKTASALNELCESKVKEYRDANKTLVKNYTKRYLEANMKDVALLKFMKNIIEDDALMFSYVFAEKYETLEDTENNASDTISYVCNNQKWFKDLVFYLTGQYDEQQLLKSDFFKVVNDKTLINKFKYNTQQIECLQPSINFAVERKAVIQSELRNKYTQEVLNSKQR